MCHLRSLKLKQDIFAASCQQKAKNNLKRAFPFFILKKYEWQLHVHLRLV